jgi:hypothetical protein
MRERECVCVSRLTYTPLLATPPPTHTHTHTSTHARTRIHASTHSFSLRFYTLVCSVSCFSHRRACFFFLSLLLLLCMCTYVCLLCYLLFLLRCSQDEMNGRKMWTLIEMFSHMCIINEPTESTKITLGEVCMRKHTFQSLCALALHAFQFLCVCVCVYLFSFFFLCNLCVYAYVDVDVDVDVSWCSLRVHAVLAQIQEQG